jgi:N-acetylmuramic acid 6-phosphate etherase
VAAISIIPFVGPEVIAGSTRLKAGTAQKMVLNMLSTASMVRLGYITGNRMTNVQTRNNKLRQRALRILMAENKLDQEAATTALEAAGGDLRLALLMTKTGRSLAETKEALAASKGVVEHAISVLLKES